MTPTRTLLFLAAMIAMFVSGTANASACEAHYSFDGSLADTTGNGNDGMMIASAGFPTQPSFSEGKFGRALHLTGGAAMRSFLDLHHETCPQFTITAWFKLASVGAAAPQAILSTGGRGGIPAIVATEASLTLFGRGNGLTQKNAIRDASTWFFVAATFDYEALEYKLYWRNRSVDGKLAEKPYPAEDSFWIGTRNDDLRYLAQDLHIDEVRVYARVLDLGEIREVARNAAPVGSETRPATQPLAAHTGAACDSQAACGAGQYCARDLTCHPDTHLPLAAGESPPQPIGSPDPVLTIPGGSPVSSLPLPAGNQPIDAVRERLDDTTDARDPLLPFSAETLGCKIDAPLTLKNNPAQVDYRVDCVVDVTAALTIEPGVVIQFDADAGLGVFNGGSINAAGTATQPIVFAATSGVAGSWRGIFVDSTSTQNRLANVRIDDAGSGYVYCCREVASLFLENARIGLSNVNIANGAAVGIFAHGSTRLTEHSGIRVSAHKGAAAVMDWPVLSGLDGTGSDYSGNAKDFIQIENSEIDQPTVLNAFNVPFLLSETVVDVKADLSIGPGVEMIVSQDGGLGVFDGGSLQASGTAAQPVVWRGAEDSPGFWRGIHTETASSNNRLSHVEIRNAGSSYVYCCNEIAGLMIKDGRMTLENSRISKSGGCGVYTAASADFGELNNSFSANQGSDRCGETDSAVAAQSDCVMGSVRLFSGDYAPSGWAFARVDTLDISTNTALYSILGSTYGGDGQSSFALPNLSDPTGAPPGTAAIICVGGVFPARN